MSKIYNVGITFDLECFELCLVYPKMVQKPQVPALFKSKKILTATTARANLKNTLFFLKLTLQEPRHACSDSLRSKFVFLSAICWTALVSFFIYGFIFLLPRRSQTVLASGSD